MAPGWVLLLDARWAAKARGFLFSYRNSRVSAEESVRTLEAEGIVSAAVRCDTTKPQDILNLSKTIQRLYKRLDVVVHMASIFEPSDPLSAQAPQAWDDNMKAHVDSAFYLCRALVPLMRKKEGGRFVFITDWTVPSGRPRYKGYTAYYASKMALKGLVEAMALELAPKILVNAIAPGPILPPPGLSAKDYQEVVKSTPLGRWGGPEEIAKAVQFLTETDFVTGETIRVDGGRHLYFIRRYVPSAVSYDPLT